MHTCSLLRSLKLVPGDMSDYAQLAVHHYRQERPVAVKAVYVLRPVEPLGSFGRRPAAVIVYTMPNPRVALRALATGGLFAGLDRPTELAMLNRSVRCIARVIVEPPLRGIGLATRLVRETLSRMEVPIVEALGVMPRVHPFPPYRTTSRLKDKGRTPDPSIAAGFAHRRRRKRFYPFLWISGHFFSCPNPRRHRGLC